MHSLRIAVLSDFSVKLALSPRAGYFAGENSG